jgi:hypothetical protein
MAAKYSSSYAGRQGNGELRQEMRVVNLPGPEHLPFGGKSVFSLFNDGSSTEVSVGKDMVRHCTEIRTRKR